MLGQPATSGWAIAQKVSHRPIRRHIRPCRETVGHDVAALWLARSGDRPAVPGTPTAERRLASAGTSRKRGPSRRTVRSPARTARRAVPVFEPLAQRPSVTRPLRQHLCLLTTRHAPHHRARGELAGAAPSGLGARRSEDSGPRCGCCHACHRALARAQASCHQLGEATRAATPPTVSLSGQWPLDWGPPARTVRGSWPVAACLAGSMSHVTLQ